MKTAIALAISLLLASGAYASKEEPADPPQNPAGGALLDCSDAAPVTCGDTATGDLDGGAGLGNVVIYEPCTTFDYPDCTEAVYEVCLGGAGGDLTVDMTYDQSSTNDMDLFLYAACDETIDCIDGSFGTSGIEAVSGTGLAPGTYYVVVDGWNGFCDPGTHDIAVTCDEPCSVPVEPTTWGEIKARHSN